MELTNKEKENVLKLIRSYSGALHNLSVLLIAEDTKTLNNFGKNQLKECKKKVKKNKGFIKEVLILAKRVKFYEEELKDTKEFIKATKF